MGEAAVLTTSGGSLERLEPVPETTTLLSRAQDGDLDAFDALMQAHQRQVFGTAWRLLGSVEDAQDAAQEVFLRLYRHLQRLDPDRDPAPWLYRVTVNLCRSLARRGSIRKTSSLDETNRIAELPSRDPTTDPAATLRTLEERQIAERGLRTLTRKEREALVLRDIQGLSTREVAEAQGTSEVTVRSHISRARLKMQRFRADYLQGKKS